MEEVLEFNGIPQKTVPSLFQQWDAERPTGSHRSRVPITDAVADVGTALEISFAVSVTRLRLECGLLGGLQTHEICEVTGLTRKVVIAYKHILFGVEADLIFGSPVTPKAIYANLPRQCKRTRALFRAVRHLSYEGGGAFTRILIPLLDQLLEITSPSSEPGSDRQEPTQEVDGSDIQCRTLECVRLMVELELASHQLIDACSPPKSGQTAEESKSAGTAPETAPSFSFRAIVARLRRMLLGWRGTPFQKEDPPSSASDSP